MHKPQIVHDVAELLGVEHARIPRVLQANAQKDDDEHANDHNNTHEYQEYVC